VAYQPQLPIPTEWPQGRPPRRDDEDWRIDEPTRRVGRRGLAAARAALARTALVQGPRADAA